MIRKAEAAYVIRLSEALCVQFRNLGPVETLEEDRRQMCTQIVIQGKIDEIPAGDSVQIGQFVSERLGRPRSMIGTQLILTKKAYGYPLLMAQYRWARDTIAHRCPERLRARERPGQVMIW